MDNNLIPQVSEIEITYHPVIKPSQMPKISCSRDAEKIFRSIWGNKKLKDRVEQIAFSHTLKVLNGNISVVFYDHFVF
jgi:hypothetical protein